MPFIRMRGHSMELGFRCVHRTAPMAFGSMPDARRRFDALNSCMDDTITAAPHVCRLGYFQIPVRAIIVSFAALLSACASTPDVTYSYYPARSESTVTLTQTIACNKDNTAFVIVHKPDVTTRYSADHSRRPFTLPINKLDGFFADSELKADFSDDGRLKGINTVTTG